MIYGVGFEAGAGASGDAESLAVCKENAHVSNVLSVTHDASLCRLLLSKHHKPLCYVVNSFQHGRVEAMCVPAHQNCSHHFCNNLFFYLFTLTRGV